MLGILDRSLLVLGGTGLPPPPSTPGARVRVSGAVPSVVHCAAAWPS